MVRYSCHIHLTRVIREIIRPPHYVAAVSPVGGAAACSVCGKKALWTVNEG